MDKGENPRFVVTNLSSREYEAQELYEKLYCARGEMENRIKEQQLYLFADRTSSATMRANQLRLWFSSLAYVILNELRRVGLRGTEWREATCQSIRLKLLKIGASHAPQRQTPLRQPGRRISVSGYLRHGRREPPARVSSSLLTGGGRLYSSTRGRGLP